MNPHPLRRIRRRDVEALARDGVVFLPGLLDRDWIDRMSRALGRVERRQDRLRRRADLTGEDLRGEIFLTVSLLWTGDPDFAAFAFESPASVIARDLMRCRSRLGLFLDQAFIQKRGATPSGWHHARSAVPLTGGQFLNMWIPFDRVPKGRGGLAFVRGSHRWDRFFMDGDHHLLARKDRRFGEGGRYRAEPIPDVDAHPERFDVVTWDYEAGDAVAFGMGILHKATGDASTSIHRRAITTRWWGDDIRFDHRPRQIGPFARVALRTGDRLDGCDLFPTVWARRGDRWRRLRRDRYDPAPYLEGPVYLD